MSLRTRFHFLKRDLLVAWCKLLHSGHHIDRPYLRDEWEVSCSKCGTYYRHF